MTSAGRPTDAAILASVASTLDSVVLPAVHDPDVSAVLVQLIALSTYGAERGPDPAAADRQELMDALDALAGNPLTEGCWPGEPFAVAAAALVACIGRDDAAADEVRRTLHPLLVGHLDAQLASTAPLLRAFSGRPRGA